VAVGQEQVFFRDVIAGDPDVAGQLSRPFKNGTFSGS
jgi:hypothetical protein